MKPLIYGYMRIHDDGSDQETRRREQALRDFVEVEGYCFAAIFQEDTPGRYAAFSELMHELQRTEARHGVVPSLDDLSRHPLLLHFLIIKLEALAGVLIHVAEGNASDDHDHREKPASGG